MYYEKFLMHLSVEVHMAKAINTRTTFFFQTWQDHI